MTKFFKTSPFAAAALAGLALLAPSGASAAITALDLTNYTLTGTYTLPSIAAAEASAVTYNWTTDTLFVLGDEGDALVEVTRTGAQLSSMTLTGFADTEGLTYVGGGQFVLTEERLRNAYLLNYTAGGSVDSAALPVVDFGTTVGNTGIEGISYDPRDGSFITVKEISPQEVNRNVVNFGAGTAAVSSLFTPNLGVTDLSDVQVLATVSSLTGTADEDNLLIFSQESARLLEVDRSGNVLSQYDFSALADSAEGVTIDANGNIYIVAENGDNPLLFELAPAPVPAPPALVLLGSALAGLAGMTRRRKA
ncbi:MAG: SdiA-regulated domain-containing protein [Gammaproteobacteria bacterium]|nr:SdiA-regulated domain-containing protein [Gammaproteobacteria bacterium]